MVRILNVFVALLVFAMASAASAEVRLTFHSIEGSRFFGRYPHTFVSMEGTLSNGQRVKENYGFSAKKTSRDVLRGPVEHIVMVEPQKWLDKSNKHFSVTLNDRQFHDVRREMLRWRNAPGKYYDLNTRNCIHFVGSIARTVGLKVDYPAQMLRRPTKWLNHIGALNPKLRARPID